MVPIERLMNVVLAIALVAIGGQVRAQETSDPSAPQIASTLPEPGSVEVILSDKSVLKLQLADEAIEIATPHGTLKIPASDILRIEFAQRLSPEVAQLIDQKIGQLKDADPDVQKAAAAELLAMREQAYLALLKAARSGDPAVAPHAAEIIGKLRKAVSKRVLDSVRNEDFIETPETKISGRITMPSLKIRTSQFGDLALKLADARSLRHTSLVAAPMPERDPIQALPDPGNMKAYETQQGKVFAFTVTGGVGGGGLWGTDVYTTDSRLSLAAVHAGIVKPGETGVVYVKMIPSPPAFTGSTRNGIASSGYGMYTAAYQVLQPDDPEVESAGEGAEAAASSDGPFIWPPGGLPARAPGPAPAFFPR